MGTWRFSAAILLYFDGINRFISLRTLDLKKHFTTRQSVRRFENVPVGSRKNRRGPTPEAMHKLEQFIREKDAVINAFSIVVFEIDSSKWFPDSGKLPLTIGRNDFEIRDTKDCEPSPSI